MATPDISDLPAPPPAGAGAGPDISDLPTPSAQPTYDPTEGMSTADKFWAGTGKGVVDTGRGIYQLGAAIGHAAGMVSDDKMKEIQGDVDEAHELDKPLMKTGAGKVGDIVGTAIPALAVPATGIVGGLAAGAALGTAQPVATGESRLQNALLGAAGGAAGGAVGKVFKALGGFGVPLARKAAVDTLQKEGIPLSVAQQTAAKGAQHVERASSMISDAQSEFMATQTPAFNRAVLRRIGVNDPEVTAATPDVLAPAKKKITDVMDNFADNTRTRVDDQLLDGLGDIEESVSRKLPDSDAGPIHKNISDILSNAAKNNGELDGAFYQKLRSTLGDLSQDARYAPFAHHMQDVVDDAVTRANPEASAAFGKARQAYRALKQIEPAIDASTGNISPAKLMTSLSNKANRNQALYGMGDQSLMDLSKAAKQVLPETLGNSGTPERMLGPLTVMETMRSGEPVKAALKAAGAVYGGGIAGRAMRSQGIPGKVLAKGVPGLRAFGPAANRAGPAAGYSAAESKERDSDLPADDIERAAGGRVDVDSLVSRLVNRWHHAKRATDKTTKPLLHVHDDVIAKALRIAGRSI